MTAASTPRRVRSIDAIIFDLVMLGFVALIVITAFGLGPKVRLVPLVIGLPALAGILLQLAIDLRGRLSVDRVPVPVPVPTYDPESGQHNLPDLANAGIGEAIRAAQEELAADEQLPEGTEARGRQVLLAVWSVGVYIGGTLFGFLVAVPVALFALLLVTRQRLILTLTIPAAVWLFLFLLFDQLLHVPGI